MALWELAAARNNYELRLLDNVIEGRHANERLAKAFESSAKSPGLDISPLVASQQSLSEGIGSLGAMLSSVDETLGSLLSVVDSGFAEMAYQQRLMSGELKQIIEVLQAPLDTQAKELRRRAEEAFSNGWIDDATQDFSESETLNRYDFTVHHALGTIAFVHRRDLDTAQREFGLAAQYARPKSAVDTAYALVSLAAVEEEKGNLDAALKQATDAVQVGEGTCPEAYYARGRYTLATHGSRDAATDDLEVSFWGNPALAFTAMGDSILSENKQTLDEALERFRAGLERDVAKRVDAFETLQRGLARHDYGEAPNVFRSVVKKLKNSVIPRLKDLQNRNSIADYLEAIRFIGPAEKAAREAARQEGNATAARLRQEAAALSSADAKRVSDTRATWAWTGGSVAPFLVAGGGFGAVVGAFASGGSFSAFLLFGSLGTIAGLVIRLFLPIAGALAIRSSKGTHPRIPGLRETADSISSAVAAI